MQAGDIIDGHVIESDLGGGSYGQVYKVKHQTSNDLMALKVAKNTEDPTDVLRFNAENAMMHRLSPHSHILSPISLVVQHAPNLVYYTMELADTDLTNHLYVHFDLTTSERINIFKQICNGLRHAHKINIAHRDLHWENILLKSDNVTWVIKLTDFGKAKDFTVGTSITTAEPCWGFFVSPPEISFQIWDKSTIQDFIIGDMYALGILLFSLFKTIPQIEVAGLKREIADFEDEVGPIAAMSNKDRKVAYQGWLKTVRPGNHYLRVQLQDSDDTNKINYLLERLTNIDYSKRFGSVSELEKKLLALYP